MNEERQTTASRFVRELAVFAFFLILAVGATWPLATHLTTDTLAGPDPLIDLWTIDWLSGHLFQPAALFSGNIFHPDPHAVVYSDLSLGTAVLVAPFRLVLRDPLPLYNLGVMVALTFAGWSFHALAFELTGNRSAGVLAGIFAGFGSHQLSHIYHLNLLTTGWLAILLLALHRLMRRPSAAPILLAAVSFALAAQSSGYYAVAAALITFVFAVWHWRDLRNKRTFRAALLTAVLAVLCTAPYASSFLEVRKREALRRPKGVSARLAFLPERDLGSQGYLYRKLVGQSGERFFPGLLLPVLVVTALWRRRSASGFCLVTAFVFLALSLGPELVSGSRRVPLPYAGLLAVPPLDAMRHPFTFAAVASFLLAIVAAIGWASLPFSSRPWPAIGVIAFAVAETIGPSPLLHAYPPGLPPVYRLLETLPPGPVLEIPVMGEETLLWAARHGRPTVNGVGAFAPRQTALLDLRVRNHWLRHIPDDVDDSPPADLLAEQFPSLRYLILPTGRDPGLRPLAQAFERSRLFVFLAEAEDGDRLYEFRDGGAAGVDRARNSGLPGR